MAAIAKKLYMKNAAGTQQTAEIYNLLEEAGDNYLTVKVDNVTGYVPLVSTDNSKAANGRVSKNGITYAVASKKAGATNIGTAAALSVARSELAATHIGNYILFGGGTGPTNVVDAYDEHLTRSNPGGLSVARSRLSATTIGGYCLFGGGYTSNSNSEVVDAYDMSLTRITATNLVCKRSDLASTSIYNYALFYGGTYSSDSQDYLDSYDSSLTHSYTRPGVARSYIAAATLVDRAFFAYGSSLKSNINNIGSANQQITIVNTSLTASYIYSENNNLRWKASATVVGNHIIIAGGDIPSDQNSPYDKSYVSAYNNSLTKTVPEALSTGRYNIAATTVGDTAIFAGGQTVGNYFSTVDTYNSTLTREVSEELSSARGKIAAATIGNNALFAGGSGGSNSNTVDVYAG